MADKVTPGKRKVGDGTPGPGRPKGSVNKVTADVKAMVLQALNEAGGYAYLLEQAKSNPNAFLTLVGKVLPLTVAGTGEQGEHLIRTLERRIVRPAD
jgi:hypothetical protein